jgi:DNA (cytosine-5)-methyltransferase 1
VSAGGYHHALVSGRAMGFLQSFYNGSNVLQGMDDAMGSMSTRDRHALLMGEQEPRVEDLYFRMLEPHELKVGTGFPAGYQLSGTKRDQVRLVGNSNYPGIEQLLVTRCMDTLKP